MIRTISRTELESAYEEYKNDADEATKIAQAEPTFSNIQSAAGKHCAAALSAKNIGNVQALEAHNTKADELIEMGKQLKAGHELQAETATKSESDGDHPASHYLVVEDPKKSSTFHLRVKNAKGDVDPKLMGAAHAALLGGGFRGQKYQGPNKDEAIKKLKGLYKSKNMDLPGEKASARRNMDVKALQAQAITRMGKQAPLMASIKAGGYSFQDLQSNIRDAVLDIASLNQPAQPNTCSCGPYVADIIAPAHEQGESWEAIVQGANGKLYSVDVKLDDNENVTVNGEPKEVERVTDYDYVFQPSTPSTVAARRFALRGKKNDHPVTDLTDETIASRQKQNPESRDKADVTDLEDGKDMTGGASESDANSEAAKKAEDDANNRENGGAAQEGDDTAECPNCGHEFKLTDAVTDSGYTACPECQSPMDLNACRTSDVSSLEGVRGDKLKNNYNNAALAARSASDAIMGGHRHAASLHRIAAEHAKMAAMPKEAAMHESKAMGHDQALQACSMTAKRAEALLAGGPGSGPRPGLGSHRVTGHDAISIKESNPSVTLSKFNDPSEDASENISLEKANEVANEDPSLIYADVRHDGGWSRGDGSGHEGYNSEDYFEKRGSKTKYLGPDEHGIEPSFVDAKRNRITARGTADGAAKGSATRKSTMAYEATAAAHDASSKAHSTCDPEDCNAAMTAHKVAANAHQEALEAHEAVGNSDKVAEHGKMKDLHQQMATVHDLTAGKRTEVVAKKL